MKKRWLFILIGAIAILAVMGVLLRSQGSETSDLYVQPKRGPFQVTVTTTGELKAKNSVKIYGPSSTRQIRIYQMTIQRLVPEGTVVNQGDFVAELDRSELNTKMNDANLELQKAQSQYEQAMLDTLLNLSKERDNQINLGYAMEEARVWAARTSRSSRCPEIAGTSP